MREALLKKRYGIPAALLALLVSAGVATAVIVYTLTYTITTQEPLSFDEIDGLSFTYQGESDDIVVAVSNHSTKQGYGIFVDATVGDTKIDSITYSSIPTGKLVSMEDQNGDLNGDGDAYDAQYNIDAFRSYSIVVTVDSADDVAPGELTVKLDFHRVTEY